MTVPNNDSGGNVGGGPNAPAPSFTPRVSDTTAITPAQATAAADAVGTGHEDNEQAAINSIGLASGTKEGSLADVRQLNTQMRGGDISGFKLPEIEFHDSLFDDNYPAASVNEVISSGVEKHNTEDSNASGLTAGAERKTQTASDDSVAPAGENQVDRSANSDQSTQPHSNHNRSGSERNAMKPASSQQSSTSHHGHHLFRRNRHR